MNKRKIVEFVELNKKMKWKYLKKYYEDASRFYNAKDNVVSDNEVNDYINKFKKISLPGVRKEIKLKKWFFYHDKKNEGIKKGYYSIEYNENQWDEVSIPHSYKYIVNKPQRYGRTNYYAITKKKGEYADIWQSEYYIWYKIRIKLSNIEKNKTAFLNFGSSNLTTDVWLNEFPIMIGHLGLFPFKIDVTDEINNKDNDEIVLAVRISNTVSNLPFLFYNGFQFAYCNPPFTKGREIMDWKDQAWAGLADDVTLTITNKNYINDAFIYTKEIIENRAIIKTTIDLRNTSWERFKGKVKLRISKWFPKESNLSENIEKEIELIPMSDMQTVVNFEIKEPSLWSIESPTLYIAHIILENEDGEAIDDIYETFGIRTIKIKGSNFYLNDKKVVLRGTHDLCVYPNDSMICPSDMSIMKDILLHKKLGANCSRYPSDTRIHYKKIAQYADQMGFMLAWAGFFEVWIPHPEMELYANRDIKVMIKSLRNNPSIIIWEMGDESLEKMHDYRRYKYLEQVYKLVKKEDESRPILPTGWFCNDLVKLILEKKEDKLNYSQKRKMILKNFPIYNLDLTYWDFHYCPMIPPVHPNYKVINEVKETLEGQKPTVFTEFGIDGMPNWDKVLDVYGKFRWAPNPYWQFNRKQDDLNYYGRVLKQEDWKETQACQAIVLSNIISYLRENPKEFAAFYFIALFDIWTYYWGIVDVKGNCKLSYFVIQNIYKPVFISGLHGNVLIEDEKTVNISVSNFEDTILKVRLKTVIKDDDKNIVKEKEFHNLKLNGNNSITSIGKIGLSNFKTGFYSIEYYLYDEQDIEIGKNFELFIVNK